MSEINFIVIKQMYGYIVTDGLISYFMKTTETFIVLNEI